jgi:tRNA U54 and U55 pseudouridine synthase Pus10
MVPNSKPKLEVVSPESISIKVRNNTVFMVGEPLKWMRGIGRTKNLTGRELKVLLAIYGCLNSKTGVAFPGMRALSRVTGIQASKICCEIVPSIHQKGLVGIIPGASGTSGDSGRSHHYVPTLPEEVYMRLDVEGERMVGLKAVTGQIEEKLYNPKKK